MTSKKVAAPDKPASELPDADRIFIDPKQVQIDVEGFLSRRIVVVVPPEYISDDLRDGSVFKKVQASRTACLRADDMLQIRAADNSWRCDAEVISVSDVSVNLDIQKVRKWQAPTSSYADDRHKVLYESGAWYVIRIATGDRVGHGFATEGMAVNYARSLAPRKVA
jgi:hypothetical protein